MKSATTREILVTMIELEHEITAARDEAGRAAAGQGLNNDPHRFLLGVSIGFDRAIKILQGKLATLDAANSTERPLG